MYKDFYGFKENPFNITADPDFFFSSSLHSDAFSHLLYGIRQRKGILVVTGEIGTGKTTLCRTLLNRMDPNISTAFIFNPNFSDTQLLRLILKDFGIQTTSRNKFELVDRLNAFLLEETAKGKNVALIIDECQNLDVKQLEHIRMLSNLETEKQKLLQIILVGQPELLEKLRLPSLRQLNQRVCVRYHILGLNRQELGGYIRHRVAVARGQAPVNPATMPIFTESAIDIIYENTKGTPRMTNILCDRALLSGFIHETRVINEHVIHKCVQEVVCK